MMINKQKLVNPENLPVIEWQGVRVVTTETLAAGYGTDEANIRKNLSRNLERFEDGKATLYSLLSQLAGGQVYPYVVPLTEGKPAVSPPWLVFSVVSDTASDVLDGQAESRITVQIDVWATVPDDADDIREQALDAVRQLVPSVISKTQGYDPDSRLSRATLEFQVIA